VAAAVTGAGLVVLLGVLAASVLRLDSYAVAPGAARAVAERVAIPAMKGVEVYPSQGDVLFVTVGGPQVTALSGLIGWLDQDVDVLTRSEAFPSSTPTQSRTINLQRMRTSKDVASYVALSRLGFPAALVPGDVVIESVLCLEPAPDGRSCAREVPAGSVLDPGDKLVEIEGVVIDTVDDIRTALEGRRPGDTVAVTVERQGRGEPVTVEVELTSMPDEPERTLVGFVPLDTSTVDLPFEVDISSGEIGGPSAGLAFTLTLLDELTPGELTGGKVVGVTGTIDEDGNVGPIGGLRQKTTAVKAAGADVFLVPAGQSEADLAAARKEAGDMPVVAVATLDDALRALADVGGNGLALGRPGADFAA
jgi:PDZ domain-containing protein